MKKLLIIIGVLGTVFLGLIVFGLRFMGDRVCKIEIQNNGKQDLVLKTVDYTQYGNKLYVKTIRLKQNERLEIGNCVNCSTLDTLNFKYSAIGIVAKGQELKLFPKKELKEYLMTKAKIDCATYLLE